MLRTRDWLNSYRKEYRKEASSNPLKVGDKVWFFNKAVFESKLDSKWSLGTVIVRSKTNLFLLRSNDGKEFIANQRHVKKRL